MDSLGDLNRGMAPMPELPEVETFRAYLESTSLGQAIERVTVLSPEILEGISATQLRSRLEKCCLQSTRRHGKYLLAQLDTGECLSLHFGMTGYLQSVDGRDEIPAHARLMFDFDNGSRLAFICQRKLGRVSLLGRGESIGTAKGLGSDALAMDFEAFRKALQGRTAVVKSALMNQKLIAGIGNLYSDEILFQAGIHPHTKVAKLDGKALERLFQKTREVLRTAVDLHADFEKYPDHYLIPHRKKGGKCPEGGELRRTKISGRTSYYCPRCQGDSPAL
jgi:formamidopyrimidine-DNA glycosylase